VPLVRTALFSEASTANWGASSFTTSAFTPSNDSLLVVRVAATSQFGSGDVEGTISLSATLGSPTLQLTSPDATTWEYGDRIWTIPITTGASMTLTVDCGETIWVYRVHVLQYTGHDTATPVGATATGTDADGDGAASITLSASPATTSEVVAFANVSMASGTNAFTPGTGWTEVYDEALADWSGWQVQTRTGSTSTTVAWDDLSSSGTTESAVLTALEIRKGPERSANVVGSVQFLTGNGDVTVPSGAQTAVVFTMGYEASDALVVNVTLDGVSLTERINAGAGGGNEIAIWTGAAPAAGTKAMTFVWESPPTEGPIYGIVFINGINPSDWIRDVGADSVGNASPPTVSVDSDTTDLVLCFDGNYSSPVVVPVNESGWTSLATTTGGLEAARIRRINSPGATTSSATGQTATFASVAVISIKSAAIPLHARSYSPDGQRVMTVLRM